MSQLTIHPTSTIDLGGGIVTNIAGTGAWGALADNSSESYVELRGNHTGIGFPTPSIPAGGKVNRIIVTARLSSLVPEPAVNDYPFPSTLRTSILGQGGQEILVNWDDPTEVSGIYVLANPGTISTWELDLKRQDSTLRSNEAVISQLRVHKVYIQILYVTKPAVTVTAPVGTPTNTSFPLTTWTVVSDDDGGPLDQAEVRIFNDAQYGAGGFSPGGSTPFATSGLIDESAENKDVVRNWRTTTKLPNDTYRSYVRTRQHPDSNWSDWAQRGFSINVVSPANPTVTITPEDSQGRMRIDVVGNDSPRSVDAAEIERSEDGGATWTPIRSYNQGEYVGISPVSGQVTAWDYEAPMDTSLAYRARVLHRYALGEWATSNWVSSSAAQWTSDDWWIKHPTNWALNQTVHVRSQPSYTRPRRQGVFTPLGRSDPVVVSDAVRTLPNGEIIVRFLDLSTQAEMDALADQDIPLLIQAPSSHNWTDRWVKLADQTRERIVDGLARTWVFDTFPWQEVLRPDGELESLSTGGPTHTTLPFQIGDTLA